MPSFAKTVFNSMLRRRRVLDVEGGRGSTLLVGVEDVVLSLNCRMARVSAV